MADILSVTERSALMSRIRGAGNGLESQLEQLVRVFVKHPYKIIQNDARVLGTPDISIPRLRIAIFVHGCFWHRCPYHSRTPKTKRAFWIAKFERNARRDRRVARELRALGWSVWTVWEHDLHAHAKPHARSIEALLLKRVTLIKRLEAEKGSL